MEGEKQLSILYQKQGCATQFSSKAARGKCLQKEIDDLERVLSSSLAQSHAVFNHHKSQRDKLQDEHKSLWKNETELSAEIEKLITEVEKAEKCLDHATPGSIKFLGYVVQLLNCLIAMKSFFSAVEVTAGNSLFHVVVENDEISTQIIKHLNSFKGGRVTFIPLDRVKAPRVTYPQNSDVFPLLKKVKFAPNVNPAFAQVFARTVVC
ncbi:hypothetical protein CerSpe_213500 [Prunus speciosa]